MLGFTKQEQVIVLFLIFSLIVGSLVTLYQRFWGVEALPEVDAAVIEKFAQRAEEINAGDLAGGHVEYVAAERKEKEASPTAAPAGTAIAINRPNEEVAAAATSKKGQDSAAINHFVINVNTASVEELQTIPRVGPVLAQKIIDFRDQNGGFKTVEDLMRVKGIGKATFNKIRPYVSIN
jgi:comEA protein